MDCGEMDSVSAGVPMTRTEELLLSQATHGSQPVESWWCEDCKNWTELDAHLRCGKCGSDSIASNHRPEPKRDARTVFAKHLYDLAEKIR